MDWRILAVVIIGFLAVWAILLALLWALRPRDARLGDLVRVIPDVVRLVASYSAILPSPSAPRSR